VPTLSLDDPTLKVPKATADSSLTSVPVATVVQYPRKARSYSFGPAYLLRPQPGSLPELPDDIGRSSLLALLLAEYEKMSMTGKTKTAFASFEFVGVPTLADAGLSVMPAAHPLELK
jgi:hypothetical protein